MNTATCNRLDATEETDLVRRVLDGCRDSRDRLIAVNSGYVAVVAREFRGRGVAHEDLVHEGHLGLFEAARRFDPAFGVRFLTFAAWWIRKSMRAAIERDGSPVRIPSTQLRRMRGRYMMPRAVRLDHPGGHEGDGPPLSERIADHGAACPEREVLRDEAMSRLRAAVDSLARREREVLEMRYGTAGDPPKTLLEAGHALGVSRERIRQIESEALSRLRKRLIRTPIALP